MQRREGVRKYRAQGTASLRTILKDIEQKYGLPVKSLRVINPETGKPYRRDARIGTIRWNAGEYHGEETEAHPNEGRDCPVVEEAARRRQACGCL